MFKVGDLVRNKKLFATEVFIIVAIAENGSLGLANALTLKRIIKADMFKLQTVGKYRVIQTLVEHSPLDFEHV